jgi:hypothetical protein
MKKILVAAATAATLAAGGVSNAQAQEPAGPFIAGAVIGSVLGVVIAKRYPEVFDPPVIEEPAPRVVYVERPVVIKQGPPKYVYYPRHRHDMDWRHDHHRPDWH